jgi:hypothetical protein
LQTFALPLGDRAAGGKSFQLSVIRVQLKKNQSKTFLVNWGLDG